MKKLIFLDMADALIEKMDRGSLEELTSYVEKVDAALRSD